MENGTVILQVESLKKASTPQPAELATPRPRGMLSALRRWAIRRLLRSECPGYAEQADRFAPAETVLLVALTTSEPEAPVQVLEEEIDPAQGIVFRKLLRPAAPSRPRPQPLWCRL